MVASRNRGLIAAAEHGLEPACRIFQMPGKALIAEFKMNTTLSCIGMDFSRDGKYLVLLGGRPDFNISVYDLENRTLLTTPETKLKCKKDFLKVKFNPRTKREFFIMSSSTIYFYTLKEAF